MRHLCFAVVGLPSLAAAVMDPSPYLGDVDAFQSHYLWIIIFTFVAAIAMTYGIGANDVANTFGTSVGAKSLTLRQAVVIAAICEMIGAVGLGATVTDTVRKKIVDFDYFRYNPEILLIGMMSALYGASIWLLLCSYYGWPVSTTHSIIGALIGVGMCISPDAISWNTVGAVVLSWLTSPLLALIVGGVWFVTIRTFILRRGEMAKVHALRFYPAMLLMCFLTVVLLVLFKNSQADIKKMKGDHPGWLVLISFATAIVLTLITYFASIKFVRAQVEAREETFFNKPAAGDTVQSDLETQAPKTDGCEVKPSGNDSLRTSEVGLAVEITDDSKPAVAKAAGFLGNDISADALASDATARSVHENAEKFPEQAEEGFKFLQVVSASFGAISHGANDTANAIGPIAAAWEIYKHAEISSSKVDVPIWLLFMGGLGIVVGLATYGYNVMKTIGVRLTKITPSRGFCIEMGSAWVIIVGSQFGIPLSTTHCQVGATLGVGLADRNKKENVSWVLLLKIIASWVMTLFFAAVVSASLFSFISVAYAPRMDLRICQGIQPVMSNITNVDPLYTSQSTYVSSLRSVFTEIDSDGNGELDEGELTAVGMHETAKGDETLAKYSSDDDEGFLSMSDWLEWRCAEGQLDTIDYRKCEPLCAKKDTASSSNGDRYSLSGELKCSLKDDTSFGDGGFRQYAKYSVPSCQ
jgi:sodium-dependent phosphate transporter